METNTHNGQPRPSLIPHPAQARRLTAEEFAILPKMEVGEAPSLGSGHLGTVVWRSGGEYLLQIKFHGRPEALAAIPCTTPVEFGMAPIDAMLAQDAEEYVLYEELGRPSWRLDVFQGRDPVLLDGYLQQRMESAPH